MAPLLSMPDPLQPVPQSHQRSESVRSAVLGEIFCASHTTISGIADTIGVSRPTVTRAVADLIDSGYVAEDGMSSPKLGRPARRLTPGAGSRLVMGIDVSPSCTRLRVVTVTGILVGAADISEVQLTTGDGRSASVDEWIDLVDRELAAILEVSGWDHDQISTAVASVSGIVDREGAVLLSRYVPRISGIDLRSLLTERLRLPEVIVENDMNLRAFAELSTLAERGVDSFVYLTNHTALRPATVTAGRVHPGAHGAVGEAGILTKVDLIPETIRHDGQEIPFFEIAPRLDRGELDAWWSATFEHMLAKIIAVLVYPLDPQTVVISGGPTTTSTSSLGRIRRYLLDWLPGPFLPELVAAGPEQYAILSGSLRLALRQAISRDLSLTNPPIPDITLETLT